MKIFSESKELSNYLWLIGERWFNRLENKFSVCFVMKINSDKKYLNVVLRFEE